ncbi:MAG: DnaJ C-terminal domain-containing protein, partial [Thermodesulfobacteriota bacterium]
ETCRYCGGAGQVTRSQGFFTVRTSCPYCHGEGRVIPKPCPECRGQGLSPVKKKVSVRIPGGVESGSRLRLTGEGEAAPGGGGLPGDLYVFLTVKPHDFFQREGNDIICQVPVSFVQASLGDEIMVPTLKGETTLSIPKGIQSGDVLTLKGEGIPSLRTGKRGDQIIQVLVKTPTNLSKKQEALLQEFAALEEKKFSTKLKKILGKAG